MAIAVAFAIGAAVTVLAASGGFSTLEWKLYDAYLGLLPARPMPGTFLVVYPESGGSPKRRSAKDALQVLRLLDEFEVGEVALVGDPFEGGAELEELSALRSGLPGLVDRESKSVQDNIRALFGAIRSGSIPPRELGRYVDLLAGIVATSGERIKEGSGIEQGSTLRELEAEIARYRHYGASFPGIQADPDKVLRRLPLVEKADDGLVSPRVELEALMRTLGNPLLEYEAGRVMLRDATSSEPRKPKAVIPVDGEGRALLDWSRTEKEEKVRKIAVGEVLKAIQEEEAFYAALVAMEAGGLLGGDGSALLSRYRHAQMLGEARAPADKAASADWRDSRKEFFMAAQGYFDAGHEAGLVAALEVVKETTVLNSDGLAAIDDRIAEITRSYRESAAILKALVARRGELSASIGGSFAFLSLVPAEAPLLTSFGMATNPAEAAAVFAGAVLRNSTPRAIPSEVAVASGLLLCLVAASAGLVPFTGRGWLPRLGIGLGAAFVGCGVSVLAFVLRSVFIPALPLALGPVAACAALLALTRGQGSRQTRLQRKKVAVLACRAEGLVRASEGASPGETGLSLAAFRGLCLAAIEAGEGIPARSDGAMVLAFFEAKKGRPNPETRALTAGLALGKSDIAIHAGLDHGDCLVEKAPSGTARKAGRILVGPSCDLAQRLADLNGHYGTKVLATGGLLERGGPEFKSRLIGELVVEETGRKASLHSILEGPAARG